MLVNVATSYACSLRFLKHNLLNRLQTCLSCFRQVNEIAIVLTVQCSTLRSGSDSIATPIHELNYPPLELRDSTSIIIIPGHSKRNHFCFLAAKLGVVILHLPKIPCPRRAPVKAFINSGRGIRIVSLYCPACIHLGSAEWSGLTWCQDTDDEGWLFNTQTDCSQTTFHSFRAIEQGSTTELVRDRDKQSCVRARAGWLWSKDPCVKCRLHPGPGGQWWSPYCHLSLHCHNWCGMCAPAQNGCHGMHQTWWVLCLHITPQCSPSCIQLITESTVILTVTFCLRVYHWRGVQDICCTCACLVMLFPSLSISVVRRRNAFFTSRKQLNPLVRCYHPPPNPNQTWMSMLRARASFYFLCGSMIPGLQGW